MSRVDKIRTSLLGKEYETNSCGRCFIVDYKKFNDVTVMFYDPVFTVKCELGNLRKGNVVNPYFPSFAGAGYMGVGEYSSKNKRVWSLWHNLIYRVYCEKRQEKQPTYKGVTVCKEWLNFQNFAAWCYSNDSFHSVDEDGRPFYLDKDLLSLKGNKIYSPKTCCFVPQEINTLVINSGAIRGELPVGVTKNSHGNKFAVRVNWGGKNRIFLGSFNTPEEAFEVYKETKMERLRFLVDKWKSKIDKRVTETLLSWEFKIDD